MAQATQVVLDYVGRIDPAVVPAELLDAIAGRWQARLKAERELILARLLAKINSKEAFDKFIAIPANEAWKAFVSDNWPKADIIRLKHRIKLLRVPYDVYKTRVETAFQAGGRFEQGVDAAVPKYKTNVHPVLAFVGTRYAIGFGPAVKAAGLVTGDHRVVQYIDPEREQLQGGPVNVFPAGIAKQMRSALVQTINFGIIAFYGALADLDTEVQQVLTYVNEQLDRIMAARMTDTYPTAYVHLEYDPNTNTLNVHAHVEATAGG